MPLAALLAIARPPRLKLPIGGQRLAWADNLVLAGLMGLCLLQVAAGTYSPFLYFRF
jgi:hypothetical protein